MVGFAQSGIEGVVKDSSGAVVPGVTVEASSPALIEGVRRDVTGRSGSYEFIDLRPGTYTVTFSLRGFGKVKRQGIELPPAFTATVDVTLSPGSVEETITVTDAPPLVDAENVGTQRVLDKEQIDAMPTARAPQAMAAMVPGVTAFGIAQLPGSSQEMGGGVHGDNKNGDYQIDGVTTSTFNGNLGAGNNFRISQAYTSQVNVKTGGGMIESAYGAMILNVVPKEGGNDFHGSVSVDFTNSDLSGSNLTPQLQAQGLTAGSLTKQAHYDDISAALGGRLIRNKLWFFTSVHRMELAQTRAGVWDNLTPLGWAYTPDLSRPSLARVGEKSASARLTWSASPRNKFSAFLDVAPYIQYNRGYSDSRRISPEATAYTPALPNAFGILSWKSPLSAHFLLDSTFAINLSDFTNQLQTPDKCQCGAPEVATSVISKTEATTNTVWGAGVFPVTASNNYGHNAGRLWQWNNNVSVVHRNHDFKFGVAFQRGSQWVTVAPNGGYGVTLRNGLPNQITEYATPIKYENDVPANVGAYMQDVWTYKRVSMTLGLRYDYFALNSAPESLPAGPFVPARTFAGASLLRWKDWNPRLGVALDLFGKGKTVLKVTEARYVYYQGASAGGFGATNPVIGSVLSVTRSWTNSTQNPDGSYSINCDLANPLANGGCGKISDLNFGQNNPNATTFDKRLTQGGRPAIWETSVVIEQQIGKGIAASIGYYHKSWGNLMVTRNTLVSPANYDPYCVNVPVDPRLPGGGGNQICGYYDLNPSKVGQVQNSNVPASDYGHRAQVFDGIDVATKMKLPHATVFGGVTWGRTHIEDCIAVNNNMPTFANFPGLGFSVGGLVPQQWCDVKPPLLPTIQLTGVFKLPVGIVTSVSYRDLPGIPLTATYSASNTQITGLGRNLSGGSSVNVELIRPGTMYGARERQVDLRFSRPISMGRSERMKLVPSVDLLNVFNKTGIDSWTTTYGSQWQVPQNLQLARYVRLGVKVDF
jgi:hypothetical protein